MVWTGPHPNSLVGAENVNWTWENRVLTPVGSFRPNPFGLFDMLGNAEEWCRDGYGSYTQAVIPGDGERAASDTRDRVLPSISEVGGYRGRYVNRSAYLQTQ